ncbi:MAG: bifunctional diaminohydroxyphosphoribosylaminopyrimidine deaminase/5-amino-6-(5-phosphoribosylamino)uracil reductase RibD [Candidatus Zixiibacteriota bacterium]
MIRSAHAEYMYRALTLALKGKGKTRPNPMVGALIVKNGKIIAEGYHRAAGTPHAEIVALKKAGIRAKGATLYVTLEPCCHVGRTGPCTEAIIKAGIKTVVFAMIDPDPRINGRGAKMLPAAGITVVSGICENEARLLNETFHHFHTYGRPLVTLKIAQTLDGRIATSTGDSKWITGKEARTEGHRLRAESDAIVVGMGTVRKDDPSLTVRLVDGDNPYRLILTTSAKFGKTCQLLDKNKDLRTIVVSTDKKIANFARTPRGRKVMSWTVRGNRQNGLNLADIMEKCRAFGLRSLLIEGGARVATSFLKAGLVDKIVAFSAPMIIGSGVEAVGNIGITKLANAIKFDTCSIDLVGDDIRFIGTVRKGKK